MATETERKFLVKTNEWVNELDSGTFAIKSLIQGYLDVDDGTTVYVPEPDGGVNTSLITVTIAGDTQLQFSVEVPACEAMGIREAICVGDYVSSSKRPTVRVRVSKNGSGVFTLKGRGNGLSRPEYEYDFDANLALEIIGTRSKFSIEKIRYVFPASHGLKWELDVFEGRNLGLHIAEIEMPTEDTEFDRPDWLGDEVTYDPAFTNVALAREPLDTWPESKRLDILSKTTQYSFRACRT
jgi:adenylate cyclase